MSLTARLPAVGAVIWFFSNIYLIRVRSLTPRQRDRESRRPPRSGGPARHLRLKRDAAEAAAVNTRGPPGRGTRF